MKGCGRAFVTTVLAVGIVIAAPAMGSGARADEGGVMVPDMPERTFLMPSLPAEPQYVPGTDEKFPACVTRTGRSR